MLTPGQQVELTIEKPAAGGRMIARHDGQVVLVGGAVPGERVAARIERVERRLAFASVVNVNEPSPDRRPGLADPACGGCVYSHIAYARQLTLKSEILRDAFGRLGRIPIDGPIPVAPSPERGHRMRARLHADGGRVGFFREGTHELCDAEPSGQLTAAALDIVVTLVGGLRNLRVRATSVELTENIPGDEQALSIDVAGALPVNRTALSGIDAIARLTGCVFRDEQGNRVTVGEPSVADSLAVLTNGRVPAGAMHRHPESFFQANRYLVPDLVNAVLDATSANGAVLDLYAGVGLFSVALAASGRRDLTAVEGDRTSGIDLQRNAGPFGGALTLALESVERYVTTHSTGARTVIVDPPRTGMSAEALTAMVRLHPQRIVYVSCDPATMARDARRLIDAGYMLDGLRAFDLFPNTPHVESVGVFVNGAGQTDRRRPTRSNGVTET
jgi:23S rRNA (uracil1939-C5)-methyltransferase